MSLSLSVADGAATEFQRFPVLESIFFIFRCLSMSLDCQHHEWFCASRAPPDVQMCHDHRTVDER